MDWDDLRYALAVARTRTLTGAAEALGVSHTTVGRRIRALEERLGVRLFDRFRSAANGGVEKFRSAANGGVDSLPEGFSTTPAGADLVAVAERMESEMLSLEGRVLGRDERLTGALRVSAMELVLRAYKSAFISFTELYSAVALTVTTTDDEVSLTRREADVVLRLSNKPPDSLVGRRVGRMQFDVYAARSLVARVGQDAPLGAYPWIHWDERLKADWLDGWLAEHAPGATIAIRVDVSAAAMHELIASGVGVQFLACVEGDVDPSLVRVGPLDPFACRDLWVLTLPELRDTPRVRAFTDHMAEQLRAMLVAPHDRVKA